MTEGSCSLDAWGKAWAYPLESYAGGRPQGTMKVGRSRQSKAGAKAFAPTFFEQQSANDPAARDGCIPCGDQHGLCDIGVVASGLGKRGREQRGGSAEGEPPDTDRRVDRGGNIASDAQCNRR